MSYGTYLGSIWELMCHAHTYDIPCSLHLTTHNYGRHRGKPHGFYVDTIIPHVTSNLQTEVLELEFNVRYGVGGCPIFTRFQRTIEDFDALDRKRRVDDVIVMAWVGARILRGSNAL